MKFLSQFLGAMVLLFAVAVFRGYVLSVQWSWFVAPTFGVPEIRIPVAIGISLLVGMITASPSKSTGEASFEEIFDMALRGLLSALVVLVLGRIALAFV